MRVILSRDTALVGVLATCMLGWVLAHAWISEDSFITLRYVSNTLDGFGPVFNVGERVQGFTHPLWFLLLVLGSLLGADPILLAIGYGLVFTFLSMAVLGRALGRLVSDRLVLGALLGLVCLLWGASDPWVSFQTSGLENSLSNLFIVAILTEVWLNSMSRPGRLLLLTSLLCLNRPDFIIFTAPVVIVLFARRWSIRRLVGLSWTALPALAWLAFAWAFYGSVVPNTAYAKLGVYPSWVAAVGQGLLYLRDWLVFDTVPVIGCAILLGLAVIASRSKERVACVIGVLLYCGWVVWIGGDFMRGRMMTPVLTAAVVLGALTIGERAARSRRRARPFEAGVAVGLLLILYTAQQALRETGARISEHGIGNERLFYPGYHISHLLEQGHLVNPYIDLQLAEDLRNFAEACGHTTVHLRNTGTIAYLAGPNVSVIDTLGLTDAYIARLPRQYLIDSNPRPGHPDKHIPVSYLLSRHDLALLPGWARAISRGDCSLAARLEGYRYPSDTFPLPDKVHRY